MTKVLQNKQSSKPEFVRNYRFLGSHQNPSYSLDKLIPVCSCLIRNNDGKIISGKLITTEPKRLTVLEVKKENLETGEVVYYEQYTDDFKASANRRNKVVFEFCDFYHPLHWKKEVSVVFHTFTRWDLSSKSMRRMVDAAKERYKAIGRPVRGWLWCLELKKNDKMEFGYHIHYHLVVAIDRLDIRVKGIPEELKFEDLWGQRTGVVFIKNSVRGYLTKELNKTNSAKLIPKVRSYSRSREFK